MHDQDYLCAEGDKLTRISDRYPDELEVVERRLVDSLLYLSI